MGGFLYGYPPPPTQTNEVGQNSGANRIDPIAVPDLDNPKVIRLNESLSSLKSV